MHGVTGWRLPTISDTETLGCNVSFNGTDCGYNVDTSGSEMAHMFYVTLGNLAYFDTSGAYQSVYGLSLSNTADFINMQSNFYWSGTHYAPDPTYAWYFLTHVGQQTYGYKFGTTHAVAVRDGDVAVPAVPEPETYAMLLAGLGLLGFAAKRKYQILVA